MKGNAMYGNVKCGDERVIMSDPTIARPARDGMGRTTPCWVRRSRYENTKSP